MARKAKAEGPEKVAFREKAESKRRLSHPPAAEEPDQEKVLTLSRAFTFPRWRLGTCSMRMLRMRGRVQLAHAFLSRCAPSRTSFRGPALVGRNAMVTSSAMSHARVTNVTGTFPHLHHKEINQWRD